jgi:putative ABC transport system substrate-binding protein
MKRRALMLLLGGAMTAASGLCAQQKVPVIGLLASAWPGPNAPYVAAFGQGLRQTSWVEGQNVAVEYRWAEGRYDQLPRLATELVNRGVDVIVTSGGDPSALAAKNATSSIPIVFLAGGDPVELGLVTNLANPGGNLTGMTLFAVELSGKRVELIAELVSEARVLAQLVNPQRPTVERSMRAVLRGDARQAAQPPYPEGKH